MVGTLNVLGDDFSWRTLTLAPRIPPRVGLYGCPPGALVEEDRFNDFDLWLATAGSGSVRLDGRETRFEAGQGLLVPPRVAVRLANPGGVRFEMVYFHFDALISGRPMRDARPRLRPETLTLTLPGLPPLHLLAPMDTHRLAQALLATRHRHHDDLVQLHAQAALQQAWLACRQAHVRPTQVRQRSAQAVDHAVRYLEQHLARPLRVADVAGHVGVSPAQLNRLFARQLAASPKHYLARIRMARARELLHSPDLTIGEIAQACGYGSPALFSRAFRAAHGRSPRDYRTQKVAIR